MDQPSSSVSKGLKGHVVDDATDHNPHKTSGEEEASSGAELFDIACLAGLAHLKECHFSKAVERFRLAEKLSPGHLVVLYNLGRALVGVEHLDAACECLNEAIRIKPDFVEAHTLLSRVLILQNKNVEAIEHVQVALKIAPDDFFLTSTMDILLSRLKRWDEAYRYLEQAERLQPNNPEIYRRMGKNFMARGMIVDAVRKFDHALSLSPENQSISAEVAEFLRCFKMFPLSSYYARMALYYGKEGDDVKNLPVTNTLFLDRHKALRVALQGHRLDVGNGDSVPHVCYCFGGLLPDAPSNLVCVPWPTTSQALVDFFLTSRRAPPGVIDFDPDQAKERHFAKIIGWMMCEYRTQSQLGDHSQLKAACRRVRPEFQPHQPLRVFLASSYNMGGLLRPCFESLAEAFRKLGCDVLHSCESSAEESLHAHHHMQDQMAFNPNIVFTLNERCDTVHPDTFNVTWWQDATPFLMSEKPCSWRKRDLVYSYNKILDPALHAVGAPNVQRQMFCLDENVFHERASERKRKIVVIGASRSNALLRYSRELIMAVEEMCVAGEAGTCMDEAQLAKRLNLPAPSETFDCFTSGVWNYVVRDLSVRWLCELAPELDVEVDVYGVNWHLVEGVKPYHRGTLAHGVAVANAYNGALFTLAAHDHDLGSLRLVEAAACGCTPIVYDCRYQADKPHWDEHFLWYRTKEDLRACLTGPLPSKGLQAFCHGRTYTDFARKILADVASHLAG